MNNSKIKQDKNSEGDNSLPRLQSIVRAIEAKNVSLENQINRLGSHVDVLQGEVRPIDPNNKNEVRPNYGVIGDLEVEIEKMESLIAYMYNLCNTLDILL